MILLNPGPVTLTSQVRAALAERDVCHREPEFADLTMGIAGKLEQVHTGPESAESSYRAVLISGSGTAAVESMLATFAPTEELTLVVTNGVYGERMATMLERQRKPFVADSTGWTTPLDTASIASSIRTGRFSAVAVVHHETTTGTLNDLDLIAAASREAGCAFLVDAVSSFGGEDVAINRWRPLAVAGSANKCLHGAPGLSFVLIDDADARARVSHAPVLYLDLEHYRGQRNGGHSPFTLPTHVAFALDSALDAHAKNGGWEVRRDGYRRLTTIVRDGLGDLGLTALVDVKRSASMLTAFRLPSDIKYDRLHDDLKRDGFIVYAGQGSLAGRVLRVATMGDIDSMDMRGFVSCVAGAIAFQRM
jgi:2-aminoethylphosphonate-pyruvate transaminase